MIGALFNLFVVRSYFFTFFALGKVGQSSKSKFKTVRYSKRENERQRRELKNPEGLIIEESLIAAKWRRVQTQPDP